MTVTVYARDAEYARTGELDDFRLLEVPLRYNDVSTWAIECDADSHTAQLLSSANGVVIVRDGVTLLSGPRTARSVKLDGGQLGFVFSGVDDTVWLQRRLALPVPTGPPYTAAAYDVRRGVAETVMRAYVDVNAGPSAVVARRVAGLVLATDLTRGAAVVGTARFDTLLEQLQQLGLSGGVGFRVAQSGTQLVFGVYVPVDRSASAVFSVPLGNLQGFDYADAEPTATYAVVGGTGELTARTFVEGGAAGALDRREVFVDARSQAASDELTQARDAALVEGAATRSLAITPIDTPSLTFGRDYGLGDRVTVLVEGVAIVDVVREVKLTLTAVAGETLTPVVGTPGAHAPDVPQLFDTLRRQARRLSRLERR